MGNNNSYVLLNDGDNATILTLVDFNDLDKIEILRQLGIKSWEINNFTVGIVETLVNKKNYSDIKIEELCNAESSATSFFRVKALLHGNNDRDEIGNFKAKCSSADVVENRTNLIKNTVKDGNALLVANKNKKFVLCALSSSDITNLLKIKLDYVEMFM